MIFTFYFITMRQCYEELPKRAPLISKSGRFVPKKLPSTLDQMGARLLKDGHCWGHCPLNQGPSNYSPGGLQCTIFREVGGSSSGVLARRGKVELPDFRARSALEWRQSRHSRKFQHFFEKNVSFNAIKSKLWVQITLKDQ